MCTEAEEIDKLRHLRGGSKSAFEFFYNHYRPFLYANIYKWVKCHEVAQEIFHDTLLTVWHHRASIDVDKSFKSYLYKIAQNYVLDYFKKVASDQNKREAFKLNYAKVHDVATEEAIHYSDTKLYFDGILEKVPTQCRKVYVLCKIEGYSHKEVSQLLNISISTVNNHVVKASRIIKNNWRSEIYTYILFFLLFG